MTPSATIFEKGEPKQQRTPRIEERSIAECARSRERAVSPQQLVISAVRDHVCTMRIRVSDVGSSATATECDAATAEAHPSGGLVAAPAHRTARRSLHHHSLLSTSVQCSVVARVAQLVPPHTPVALRMAWSRIASHRSGEQRSAAAHPHGPAPFVRCCSLVVHGGWFVGTHVLAVRTVICSIERMEWRVRYAG